MTSFKISYSSDSIEGISSLARLSAGAETIESVSGSLESSPPPAPGLQGSDGQAGSVSNQSEATPPPIPELPGTVGMGDSDQAALAPPPVPPLNDLGTDGGPADSAGQAGMPPSPDLKAKKKTVTKAGSRQKK